jgi:hypothetical protein
VNSRQVSLDAVKFYKTRRRRALENFAPHSLSTLRAERVANQSGMFWWPALIGKLLLAARRPEQKSDRFSAQLSAWYGGEMPLSPKLIR